MLSSDGEVIPEGKVKDFITGELKKVTAEEIIRQNIEKAFALNTDMIEKPAIDVPDNTASGNKEASVCAYNELGR
jgi:predicted Ser/Thr protein kinase